MSKKIEINILRAFVDDAGKNGNPTGIIIDEKQQLNSVNRQKIATKLHFTDTVFINNLKTVHVSFFNPQHETKFAGDALISTSYYVSHVLGIKLDLIICKAGRVKTWSENGLSWIEARLVGTPPWNHRELENSKAIDTISPEAALKYKHTLVWAWINEEKGVIRSRTFLPDWGTLEDQGNGSGSMQLAKIIGRKIEIHQGLGSVIYARPTRGNLAIIGGRVKVDKSKKVSI